MTRNKQTSQDTRTILMMTAGKLFAELGYDKVSTRKIADAAQVNLGGIHYHFGSKENLYIEAFKYAVEASRSVRFGQTAEEHPQLVQSPAGLSELICIVAKRTFADLQDKQHGAWVHEILLRELYFPSSAEEALAVHVFKPKIESSLQFFDRINPAFTLEDKLYYSTFISANAMFYAATFRSFKVMYAPTFNRERYFKKAELRTAKALIQLLGLPIPAALQS